MTNMQDAPSVPTIVLAGGSDSDKLAKGAGCWVKSLVPVDGRPMLDYMVDALLEAGCSPIVVVTSEAALDDVRDVVRDRALVVAAQGDRVTDTLLAGLAEVPHARFVLVATGDLPLLTPQSVRHFVSEAVGSGAELCYSIIRREDLTGAYNTGRRTFIRLREGQFTGGNLFLFSSEFAHRAIGIMEKAYAGRKTPLVLARLLGVGLVIRFLLGWLDLPTIVRRAEHMLDCKAKVVISPYPEVGFDMDKPRDIEVANQILAKRDKG